MEKFVKDKLKTAKMQPLPQTWDNIEAVLDKDKKAWYRRRILFIALFLVVGAGALFTMSPQNSNEPETISSESKNEKFDDLAIEEERLTNSKMELQAGDKKRGRGIA